MLPNLNEQKMRVQDSPILIYHHNDLDGKCSAAIMGRYATERGYKPQYISVDYKDEIQVGSIPFGGNIAILDFSFKPDVMQKVRERAGRIIWCDHHATAKDYGYDDLPGYRDFSEKGLAGCECTWKACYPEEPIPFAVALLGDYDAWRLEKGEQTFRFYEGLKTLETEPESEIWSRITFNNDGRVNDLVYSIMATGRSIIEYRNNYCEGIIEKYGYETVIDGRDALAVNIYGFGPKGFGNRMARYPEWVFIAYIHDGRKFTVSLYSEGIDVSEIAKNHGGGGHKGAAGFVCEALPWL